MENIVMECVSTLNQISRAIDLALATKSFTEYNRLTICYNQVRSAVLRLIATTWGDNPPRLAMNLRLDLLDEGMRRYKYYY